MKTAVPVIIEIYLVGALSSSYYLSLASFMKLSTPVEEKYKNSVHEYKIQYMNTCTERTVHEFYVQNHMML